MKISFTLPKNTLRHRYCQNCKSEDVTDILIEDKTYYECANCKQRFDRIIDLDPDIKWYIEIDTDELIHESVGIFVKNAKHEILLIERTIYPYGFTIPAGHLGPNENPINCAKRELFEETGIKTNKLELLFEGCIEDKCRKGADYHFWHLYTMKIKNTLEIVTDKNEGKNPVWISSADALKKDLTAPTLYFLKSF